MWKMILISNLLVLSTGAYASKYKKGDQVGSDPVYTICDGHSDCGSPNGCYPIDIDDVDENSSGSEKRDEGANCTTNFQCKTGNCNDEPQCDQWNDKNECTHTNDNKSCRPLNACKKADAGETLGGNAQCADGLVADSSGVCNPESLYTEWDNSTLFYLDATSAAAANIEINQKNCGLEVGKDVQVSRELSNLKLRALEFFVFEPYIGDDTDCLSVVKGLKHEALALKDIKAKNDSALKAMIAAQKALYQQTINENVDMHKKSEVDRFVQGLEVLKIKNNAYKTQGQDTVAVLTQIKENIQKIEDYYYAFDFSHDAKGSNGQANIDNRTVLAPDSLEIRIVRDSSKNYCRGRSPKIKNSWKRRYRISSNDKTDMSQQLNTAYIEVIDASTGKAFPIPRPYQSLDYDHKEKYFLLDPVLSSRLNIGNSNAFKRYGTEATDGGVRAKTTDWWIQKMIKETYELMLSDYINDPSIAQFDDENDKAIVKENYKKWYANDRIVAFKKDESFKEIEKSGLSSRSIENAKRLFDKLYYSRYKFFHYFWHFSAAQNKRHPVSGRATFFTDLKTTLDEYIAYYNKLIPSLDESNTCLDNKKVAYKAQTDENTDNLGNGNNYDPKADGKPKDFIGQGKPKSMCLSGKCKAIDATMGSGVLGGNTLSSNASGNSATSQGSNTSGGAGASGTTNSAALANAKKKAAYDKLPKASREKIDKSKSKMLADLEGVKSGLIAAFSPPGSSGASSSGSGGNSALSNASKDKANEGLTAAEEKQSSSGSGSAGDLSIDPLSTSSDNNLSSTGMTAAEVEAIANSAKNEEFKAKDDDSIFALISKTYVRSFPRIMTKKVQLKEAKEHGEFEIPSAKKKKTSAKMNDLKDLN